MRVRFSTVVALAALLVVLAAGGAFASTDSTYASFPTTGTPHTGYATTSVQCAVCHAVHKAPTSGQVLLPTSVVNACVYCHVDTTLGGIVIVYDGDSSIYYAFSNNQAHQRTGKSSCQDCHSVHGANTIQGANWEKILWNWPKDGGKSSYSTPTIEKWPNPETEANDDAQITAWCTGCHKYFVESYETTLQSLEFSHVTFQYEWIQNKSHIMTDLAGGYTNPAATIASGTNVAFAPSTYCRSCHDAGITDASPGVVTTSFPHYTPNYYRFMEVATSTVGTRQTNTTAYVDGLCLKCHRLDASAGVGITY